MSGNTKREGPISWRPSPAASVALVDLMERMPGMKRNEVLNLVVIAAAHRDRKAPPVAFKTSDSNTAPPEDVTKRSPMEAAQARRVHEQQLRQAKAHYSGGIDREKNLAFQRQIGMDKAPKR